MLRRLEYDISCEEMVRVSLEEYDRHRSFYRSLQPLRRVVLILCPVWLWWIGSEWWIVALMAAFTWPYVIAISPWGLRRLARWWGGNVTYVTLDVTDAGLDVNCEYDNSRRSSHHISLPWESLARTGKFTESGEFLLIDNSTGQRQQRGGVIIPKRIFDTEAELTEFQEELRRRMAT